MKNFHIIHCFQIVKIQLSSFKFYQNAQMNNIVLISNSVVNDSMHENAILNIKKQFQSKLQNKKLSKISTNQMQKTFVDQTQKIFASQIQNEKTKKTLKTLTNDTMHENDFINENAIFSIKKQFQSTLQNKKLFNQMQKIFVDQTQKIFASQMQNEKKKKTFATSTIFSIFATSSTFSTFDVVEQLDVRKNKKKIFAISIKFFQISIKQKFLAIINDKAFVAFKATFKSIMTKSRFSKNRNITFNDDDDNVNIIKAFRSRNNLFITLASINQRSSQNIN